MELLLGCHLPTWTIMPDSCLAWQREPLKPFCRSESNDVAGVFDEFLFSLWFCVFLIMIYHRYIKPEMTIWRFP